MRRGALLASLFLAGCALDQGVPFEAADLSAEPPGRDGGTLDFSTPIAPPPDLVLADLLPQPPPIDMADCPAGTRPCGRRCIPLGWCCEAADCPAFGSACQPDGTCTCPGGQKPCLQTCIPVAACCTNADCPNKLCVAGTCVAPACNDGIAGGNETDIDCGGGQCGRCGPTRLCGIDSDCRSNLCMGPSCVEPDFSRSDFGGGAGPRMLRTADLDGDGKPDVLALDAGSHGLSVLLGKGDGTFRSLGSFTTGIDPVQFDLGDLDGDGKLDAVVANSGSYDLSVLLGSGDGTFRPQRLVNLPGVPTWVAIGDQDKDGHKDVVVANSSNGSFGLLLGNGDGTFKPLRQVFTFVSRPRAVVLRDLDGDGFDDVVVQCVGAPPPGVMGFNSGAFSVHKSKPGGGFDAPVTVATQSTLQTTLFAQDLNRDGKLDLLVGSPNLLNPQIFLGDGRGGFALGRALPPVYTPWTQLVDMNGDKIVDLVSASGIQLGVGDGSFLPLAAFPRAAGSGNVPAVADFDGDGRPDVALPSFASDSVIMLPGNGDGTCKPLDPPRSGTESDIGMIAPRVTRFADLNSDGAPTSSWSAPRRGRSSRPS